MAREQNRFNQPAAVAPIKDGESTAFGLLNVESRGATGSDSFLPLGRQRRPPFWQRAPEKFGCYVEEFNYPSFIAPYNAWSGGVDALNEYGETIGTLGDSWRYGVIFDADALFRFGGAYRCPCCRFKQSLIRLNVTALGSDVIKERGEETLDQSLSPGAVDQSAAEDTYESEGRMLVGGGGGYGDRSKSGTLDAYFKSTTNAEQGPQSRKEREALRQEIVRDTRNEMLHAYRGGDETVGDKAAGHLRLYGEVDKKASKDVHGKLRKLAGGARKWGCQYYMIDTPGSNVLFGTQQFRFLFFIGFITGSSSGKCINRVVGKKRFKWMSIRMHAVYTKYEHPKFYYEVEMSDPPSGPWQREFNWDRTVLVPKGTILERLRQQKSVRVGQNERTSGAEAVRKHLAAVERTKENLVELESSRR